MILITGATGPFGFHVITSLLQLGTDATEISALVRDKKKASLVLPPHHQSRSRANGAPGAA